MIELLFFACLAASPEDCGKRSLVFTDITPQMCMRGAQPELAKWVNAHPNYTIQSWTCQQVSFSERDA